MSDDHRTGDERLLDVLLEEELGAAHPADAAHEHAIAAPRRPRLAAAAAILFGISVVVATAWSLRAPPADQEHVASQEPMSKPVTPTSWEELRSMLGAATSMRLQWLLERGTETPLAETMVAADDEDVASIRNAIAHPASVVSAEPLVDDGSWTAVVALGLRDGRYVTGRIAARGDGWLLAFDRYLLAVQSDASTREGIAALARLERRSIEMATALSAEAGDVAELEQLPRDLHRLACRHLDVAMARALARFESLTHLQCRSADADAVRLLAAARSLRTLEFRPRDPDVAADLASAPPLSLPPDVLGTLQDLTALRIHCPVDGQQLHVISGLHRLQELWVVAPDASEATARCLRSMTSLRRLVLACPAPDASPLIASLAQTRIECLKLYEVQVASGGLQLLAGLPTLRQLDLATLTIRSAHWTELESLRQVGRIDVSHTGATADQLERLRTSLPDARILGEPMVTARWYGGFPPPSWLPDWSAAFHDEKALATQSPPSAPTTATSRRQSPAGPSGPQTGPQDPATPAPQQPTVLAPKSLDEWRKLVADLARVEVVVPDRGAFGVPVLTGVPILGHLFGKTAIGAAASRRTTVDDDAALRTWREQLLACAVPSKAPEDPGGYFFVVRLLLRDGRAIDATVAMSQPAHLTMPGADLQLAAPDALKVLLEDARQAAVRAWRVENAFATTRDELRAITAAAKCVRIPCFPADVLRAELPRFTAIERLLVETQRLSQLPSGDAVVAIAALPTLRALTLPADALTDGDVERLAALPLAELGLTGRLRNLTPTVFKNLRTVRELRLDLTSCNVDARILLASMPVLQSLVFERCEWFGDDALDAVLATKVERVEFHGDVTIDRLRRFAALPSLRHLVVATREAATTLLAAEPKCTVEIYDAQKADTSPNVWWQDVKPPKAGG